jgi:thiosulfate dehydrogenase [quinone] large subunit
MPEDRRNLGPRRVPITQASAARSSPGGRTAPQAPRGRPGTVRQRDLYPTWGWLRPGPRALRLAGWALMPLRAFLGFTFCFAGLQKLANPGFFNSANPASIQAQLAGAARLSPIKALIVPLEHFAVPLGVIIALGELAVGIGTLLGLWARVAAAGGMVLSFMFFLTVSFHSNPYYTGADIVFFFAWMPLVLAGSGGVCSLDALIVHKTRSIGGAPPDEVVALPFFRLREICGAYEGGACRAMHQAPCEPAPCPYLASDGQSTSGGRRAEADLERRSFVARSAAAVAAGLVAAFGAGMAAVVGRMAGGSRGPSRLALGGGPSASTTAPQSRSGTGSSSSGGSGALPGTPIGPAKDVPVGGAAGFTDPQTGDPSLVIQPTEGRFLAFDAVCPHAGCIVQYDPSQQLFVCPCHGSEFNAQTGAVIAGPAPRGLTPIPIKEGPNGELYIS